MLTFFNIPVSCGWVGASWLQAWLQVWLQVWPQLWIWLVLLWVVEGRVFGWGAEKLHEVAGYSWHFLGEQQEGGSGGERWSFQKIWLPKSPCETVIQQTFE